MPNPTESTHSLLARYTQIAGSFAVFKLGLFLVRHPIHVVQSNKQANPDLKTFGIIINLYRMQGIRGFYLSTPASVAKILIAESYRGPLMIAVPSYINSQLPDTLANTMAASAASIPIIAVIDAALTCPMVRITTHQITHSNSKITVREIANAYMRSNPLHHLFRGYTPLLLQTMNLWGTFFVIDDIIKNTFKQYSREASYASVMAASIVGGIIQSAINIVPDTIRVQMQKADSNGLGFLAVTRAIIQKNGLKGLFSGLPHKLTAGIIGFGYKSALREFWTKDHPSPTPKLVVATERRNTPQSSWVAFLTSQKDRSSNAARGN